VQYVSANFFSVLESLRSSAQDSRPENGLEGKDSVVVIGYELWKRRFASDPAIVGKIIDLNGKPQDCRRSRTGRTLDSLSSKER